MTLRDRALIGVLALVALLGAFWFMALKPKRAEVAQLDQQIASKTSDYQKAMVRVQAGLAARSSYSGVYATMAKLGQAVPADDSVPSLVFQLDNAARATGVDFRGVKLTSAPASATSTPVTPPPSSSSGSSSSGSSSSTSSSSSSSSGSSPASSTTPAAPTQAATSTLPPGAAVGPAGFPTMPLQLTFDGSFFKMASFLRRLDRFVATGRRTVRIGGRLLTVDGIALAAGRKGFPQVKATVSATGYLVPPTQGATAGATPAGPGAATTASTTSSSSSVPPAAVATPPVR